MNRSCNCLPLYFRDPYQLEGERNLSPENKSVLDDDQELYSPKQSIDFPFIKSTKAKNKESRVNSQLQKNEQTNQYYSSIYLISKHFMTGAIDKQELYQEGLGHSKHKSSQCTDDQVVYVPKSNFRSPSNYLSDQEFARFQEAMETTEADNHQLIDRSQMKLSNSFARRIMMSENTNQQVDVNMQDAFQQLKNEAKTLYSVLIQNSSYNKSKLLDRTPTQPNKKAFKIKHRSHEHKKVKQQKMENVKSVTNLSSCESETHTLIDQIRKKFNEQKYMKREDVLKLLRDLQNQDSENKKTRVFDQSEIVKGLTNADTKKLFSTAQEGGLNLNLHAKGIFASKFLFKDPASHFNSNTNLSNGQSASTSTNKIINQQRLYKVNPISESKKQQTFGKKESSSDVNSKELSNTVYSFNYTTEQPSRNLQKKPTNLSDDKEFQKLSPLKISKGLTKKYLQQKQSQLLNPAEYFQQIHLNQTQQNTQQFIPSLVFKSLAKMDLQVRGALFRVDNGLRTRSQLNRDDFSRTLYGLGFKGEQGPLLLEGNQLETDPYQMNRIQKELYEMYMNQKNGLTNRFQQTQTYINPMPIEPILDQLQQQQFEKSMPIVIRPKVQIQEEKRQMSNQNVHIVEGCSQNNHQNLPATKIKVNLQAYTHLSKCEINKVIGKINEFIHVIVKQKIKLPEKELVNLLKYFGIQIPKVNGCVDHNQIKSKEFQIQSNFKLVTKLYKTLNKENNDFQPLIGKNSYKYYIGRGNNHYLVRQVIKRRQWWSKSQKESYGPYFWEEEGCFHPGCHFIWTQWKKPKHIEFLQKNKEEEHKLYNKIEQNFHLSNKKALFMNVSNYYKKQGLNPFEIAIPLTFHIKQANSSDKEYCMFLEEFQRLSQENCQNVWIIKPGENTNRGTGINVSNSLSEIQSLLNENKSDRTYIVQKYIENPLLINGRKFDIRGYATVTSVNGCLKGFFYKDCYFRTSCKEFSIQNLGNKYIHLTNDAIQQHSEDYGKFESGNKLSINDFQRYLDSQHSHLSINFMRDIFPQIEKLVTDSFRSVIDKIDKNRLKNSFELFGYDFMIDENFRVYLIEANTNPCLEVCCPLLSRIIPEVIDNTFRIGLDPLFQPVINNEQNGGNEKNEKGGIGSSPKKNRMNRRIEIIQQIKYVLVFDERVDRDHIKLHEIGEEVELDEKELMLEEIQEEENFINNREDEVGVESEDEDDKQ